MNFCELLMKNFVLFIAHLVNDNALCRYRKLRDELECEKYDVVWVCTAAEYDEVIRISYRCASIR